VVKGGEREKYHQILGYYAARSVNRPKFGKILE